MTSRSSVEFRVDSRAAALVLSRRSDRVNITGDVDDAGVRTD